MFFEGDGDEDGHPVSIEPEETVSTAIENASVVLGVTYPISVRKLVNISLRELRPARAQTVYITTPMVFHIKRGHLRAHDASN